MCVHLPVRCSTASRKVLDGMVPVCCVCVFKLCVCECVCVCVHVRVCVYTLFLLTTQTPPICEFLSIIATRQPRFTESIAHFCAAGPDPITICAWMCVC